MGDSPSAPRLPRPGCNAAPAAPQTSPRPQHRTWHNWCFNPDIISAIASGGTKSQPTSAPASSSPASSSAPAPTASATVKVVLTARQRHFVKDIRAQFALTRSASAIAAIGRQVCTSRRDGMRQGDVVAQISVTAHQAAVTLARRARPVPPVPAETAPAKTGPAITCPVAAPVGDFSATACWLLPTGQLRQLLRAGRVLPARGRRHDRGRRGRREDHLQR